MVWFLGVCDALFVCILGKDLLNWIRLVEGIRMCSVVYSLSGRDIILNLQNCNFCIDIDEIIRWLVLYEECRLKNYIKWSYISLVFIVVSIT